MRAYLSVKSKSLAAEARIIRRAERAALRRDRSLRKRRRSEFADSSPSMREYNGLRDHRIGIVRSEARAAHLALGFLGGLDYRRIEGFSTRKAVPWSRALDLVKKYGGVPAKELDSRFEVWKADAALPQTPESRAAEAAAREKFRAARASARQARAAAREQAKAA